MKPLWAISARAVVEDEVGNKVVGESRNKVGFRLDPSPGVVTCVDADVRDMVDEEAMLVGEWVEKVAGEMSSRKLLPLLRVLVTADDRLLLLLRSDEGPDFLSCQFCQLMK